MTPAEQARLQELQTVLLPTVSRQLKSLRLQQQALLKEERALRDKVLQATHAE